MTITQRIRHLLGMAERSCWTCRFFNGTACAREHDWRRKFWNVLEEGPLYEGWVGTFEDGTTAGCACYRLRLKDGSI